MVLYRREFNLKANLLTYLSYYSINHPRQRRRPRDRRPVKRSDRPSDLRGQPLDRGQQQQPRPPGGTLSTKGLVDAGLLAYPAPLTILVSDPG